MLIWLAWGPIMRKYGHVEEPDNELFMQAYGRHVTHAPVEVTDVTGANLTARLRKIPVRTATSVDGWAAKGLQVMHVLVWDLLRIPSLGSHPSGA